MKSVVALAWKEAEIKKERFHSSVEESKKEHCQVLSKAREGGGEREEEGGGGERGEG